MITYASGKCLHFYSEWCSWCFFMQTKITLEILSVMSANHISRLEPNCQYSCSSCCCSSSSSKIVAKYLPPPQNLCRPLKTFACVSLRYRKHCGGWVAIVVVVCGKIYGKMCCKMCGKIEKLSDWNKNLCASRYGQKDRKTKIQKDKKTKRQKGKRAKKQKDKKAKRQKDTNTKRFKKKTKKTTTKNTQTNTKKNGGPKGPMPTAGVRTRGP